jgi:DNA-binding NtrC family response regulator
MPLLRDRKDDIPLLVDFFLKKKAKAKEPKVISPDAMELLLSHDWPGNVRELEHVIEGAVILSSENIIYQHDLRLNTKVFNLQPDGHKSTTDKNIDREESVLKSIEDLEKDHIKDVLKAMKGNRTKTANILKISPKALYLKIKKYGIKVTN